MYLSYVAGFLVAGFLVAGFYRMIFLSYDFFTRLQDHLWIHRLFDHHRITEDDIWSMIIANALLLSDRWVGPRSHNLGMCVGPDRVCACVCACVVRRCGCGVCVWWVSVWGGSQRGSTPHRSLLLKARSSKSNWNKL